MSSVFWVLLGLTAGPEPLSRATVRTGLRAGVTGAAGGTGASAATITSCSGNQFLHSFPQEPRLCWAAEATHTTVKTSARLVYRFRLCSRRVSGFHNQQKAFLNQEKAELYIHVAIFGLCCYFFRVELFFFLLKIIFDLIYKLEKHLWAIKEILEPE